MLSRGSKENPVPSFFRSSPTHSLISLHPCKHPHTLPGLSSFCFSHAEALNNTEAHLVCPGYRLYLKVLRLHPQSPLYHASYHIHPQFEGHMGGCGGTLFYLLLCLGKDKESCFEDSPPGCIAMDGECWKWSFPSCGYQGGNRTD